MIIQIYFLLSFTICGLEAEPERISLARQFLTEANVVHYLKKIPPDILSQLEWKKRIGKGGKDKGYSFSPGVVLFLAIQCITYITFSLKKTLIDDMRELAKGF